MPTFRQREIGEFFRGGFLAGIGTMIRNVIFSVSLAFAGLTLNSTNALAACAVPNQLTNGQTADASQVMGNFNSVLGCLNNAPAGSTNALQYNAGSGTFGGIGPLTNGQIVIGSTGNAPQASQLTAGTGITITNGPGSIMISGAGTPFVFPILANFTWGNQPTGTTATDTSTGLAFVTPPQSGDDMTELWSNNSYTPPFDLRVGVNFSTTADEYHEAGVIIGDSTGKLIALAIVAASAQNPTIIIGKYNSYSSYNSPYKVFNAPTTNVLLFIKDDGKNLSFYLATDINAPVLLYTVSRTDFLTAGPTKIGLAINGKDTSGSNVNTAAVFYDYEKVGTP